MKKKSNKTVQSKSVKKHKQKEDTPPSSAPKKSISKKSKTVAVKTALDKVKLQETVYLNNLKAENLRLTNQLKRNNRDLEIEAALERMRASAMAMHSSEGLYDTAEILYQELSQLGIESSSSGFGLVDEKTNRVSFYGINPTDGKIFRLANHVPILKNAKAIYSFYINWKKQKTALIVALNKKETKRHETYMAKCALASFKEYSIEPPFTIEEWLANSPKEVKLHFFNFRQGCIYIIRDKRLTDVQQEMVVRFTKVFQLTYTRFLDLQKAEAQTRESQIQLALERVRARTMAMQKSDELPETSYLLFQQVKELGMTATQNSIAIINEETGFVELSTTVHGHHLPRRLNVPINDPYVMAKAFDAWGAKLESLKLEFRGQELRDYNEHRNRFFETKVLFPEDQWIVNIVFFSKGWLSFSSNKNISDETHDLLKRFAAVFEQTYIRFSDLKQAEAQAKEAEIQLALERVRARSLAMHHTSELQDIVDIVAQQLYHMGMDINGGVVIAINDEVDKDLPLWASSGAADYVQKVVVPFLDRPIFTDLRNAMKRRNNFFSNEYGKEEKDEMFDHIFKYAPWSSLTEERKKELLSREGGLTRSAAIYQYTSLAITNHNGKKFSEEEHEILKRFATVFEQSYTRFLDLQKAEAQAREAQIEAAVERVRAKALAMHKSDEIMGVAVTMRNELEALNIMGFDAVTITLQQENGGIRLWDNTSAKQNENGLWESTDFVFRLEDNNPLFYLNKIWNSKEKYCVVEQNEKDLLITIEWVSRFDSALADVVRRHYKEKGIKQAWHPAVQLVHGRLNLDFYFHVPEPEMETILLKMGAAFDLAYKRFLDLQKAEAQAREAQIQLALERVRARTMAMHKSDELPEVVFDLFEQMHQLGFAQWGATIALADEARGGFDIWFSTPESRVFSESHFLPNQGHPVAEKIWNAFKEQIELSTTELKNEEKLDYDQWMFANTPLGNMPANVKAGILSEHYVMFSISAMKYGFLEAMSLVPIPVKLNEILPRFAKVFEQTYTRFLDLQKAEAQAYEAKVEVSLERIRSRSLAMHNSNELAEVSTLLFKELFGFNDKLKGSGIVLCDREIPEQWMCSADLNMLPAVHIPKDLDLPIYHLYQAWEAKQELFYETLNQEEVIRHSSAIMSLPEIKFIFDSIPQSEIETPRAQTNYAATFKQGYLLVITEFPVEGSSIFPRFAKVFEQTYTRFLDLQKAEAQAIEAKIEAALEKVRSRSLAMHKSNELIEVVKVVFQKLQELDFAIDGAAFIGIFTQGADQINCWIGDNHTEYPTSFKLPFYDSPQIIDIWNAKNNGIDFITRIYSKEEKNHWFQFAFEHTDLKTLLPDHLKSWILNQEFLTQPLALAPNSMIGIHFHHQRILSEKEIEIQKRFSLVFEQAYIRFLDLQKAEAQAREAQIQLALERVRARTMAMHKSSELSQVSASLYKELQGLGVTRFVNCGYIEIDEAAHIQNAWMTNADGTGLNVVSLPLTGDKVFDDRYVAWKRKDEIYHQVVGGDLLKSHIELATQHYRKTEIDELVRTRFMDPTVFYCGNFSHGYLHIITDTLLGEENESLLIRFTRVFEMTYKRFLDLQKAEAQAREAQIEAALERVRSRSMGMQKSEELRDIIQVIYEQFIQLGIHIASAGFATDYMETDDFNFWFADAYSTYPKKVHIPYLDHPQFNALRDAKVKGVDFYTNSLTFDEKNKFFDHLLKDAPPVPQEFKDVLYNAPGYVSSHVFVKNLVLYILNYTDVPFSDAENEILIRFGKVFEQAYIRFLDLQKAETQAREAQIEAALERVRSRSMGMQKSEELREVIQVIYEQMVGLNIKIDSAGFDLEFRESDDWNIWHADAYTQFPNKIHVPYFNHPFTNAIIEAKNKGVEFLTFNHSIEDRNKILDQVFKYAPASPEAKEALYNTPGLAESHVYLKNVFLYISNYAGIPYTDAENAILMRFGKVFEQTYVRFNDLKQAEAQTREAIKRASVDRVRAEIASMRTTSDLERIIPLIWSELTTLGVPFIRCGVFIMDEANGQIQTLLSTPEGKSIASFQLPFNDTEPLPLLLPHWQRREIYKEHWDEAAFIESTKILMRRGAITSQEQYTSGFRPTNLHLHFLPFLQGMLYVGSAVPLTEDEVQLAQNLADAFSTAYARYEDFNKLEAANNKIEKTLVDLKQTQAQLIQSEKMASLGQLTAGIAHEIQNPLNFVNNFSEVNAELIDEIKQAVQSGNSAEILTLADNVKQNLEKINFHGKRADGIVKSMLQHSRSSDQSAKGVKEPTDINVLADEYLRLAYHGLRAKDKTFNATLQTDFDERIGLLQVMGQDIARAILNLITNAFYAVQEKQKEKEAGGGEYNPMVSISTKRLNHSVEIRVKDNGPGIPQGVLDKIFQPFFTTKPTGQGTGLGLSLCYDIVKAHGGELKVETEVGKGSEFIIQLPV